MFEDRTDAGKRLAVALDKYRDSGAIVLAIPRGGVEVGYQVAEHLHAEFSLVICRKLPYPSNPEAGFGAIAEDGSTYIQAGASAWLSQDRIAQIVGEQQREIARRVRALRQGRPLPDITSRTVILVDDGLAMGSTMRVAIMLCKNKGAGRIVVAVPVAGQRVEEEMRSLADEVAGLVQSPPRRPTLKRSG